MTGMLDAALCYGEMGWPVVPIHGWVDGRCTCGKDCSSPAKHPRNAHGLTDASSDADTIVAWWRKWPNANVGLRTGDVFDVLDVDGEEGRQSILSACAEYGPLPGGPWSLTGGGGDHLFFLPTGSRNRAGMLHKVDWRGDGGYIVAPPSMHASGARYEWQEGPETTIEAAPEWLLLLVAPAPVVPDRPLPPVRFLPAGSIDGTPYGLKALEAELAEFGRSPQGTRNHNLNTTAFNLFQLVAGGELQEGIVVNRLMSVAMNIGLPESEVRTTIGSARKKGITLPRSAPERPLRLVVGGEPLPPEPEDEYDYEPHLADEEEKPRLLEIIDAAELVRRVDSAPPVGWLVKPIWPADAYGILAAEQKAGKTWSGLDLVISVASSTPWLGMYDIDRPGMVLAFLGEGGERKMKRRLDAICASRGVSLADLPIRFCFRVPTLTNLEHLLEMHEEIKEHKPVFVYLDPLYLAAKGADGSKLYAMAEHLSDVQILCQRHGAALMIVHHWNKTGEGKGSKRMSGAGPGEWGRVLISVSVVSKHTDSETKRTDVVLEWGFEGDEIPDEEMRIRRKVWSDDPESLTAPMHYEVEALGDAFVPSGVDLPAMKPSSARVLAVLRAAVGSLMTSAIGDALAADGSGIPLKKRTIQVALEELEALGLAEKVQTFGSAHIWRAQSGPEEVF